LVLVVDICSTLGACCNIYFVPFIYCFVCVEEILMEEIVTVKELIIKLLEQNMLDEVIVKDKDGNRLHDVEIVAIQNEGLGALFG